MGSIDLAVLDSTHVIITYGVGTTGYAVIATISGTTYFVRYAGAICDGACIRVKTALLSRSIRLMWRWVYYFTDVEADKP